MTSLVSYPVRGPWGDATYRGNCGGGLLRDLVLQYRPQSVADPMMGSGTSKDVIDDLNRRSDTPIGFWGSDLRYGFNILTDSLPASFDFVWVHPPYWNIIRYSGDPSDLSNCTTFDGFIGMLFLALRRCYDALLPGGRLAILIGDVRRKGQYFPLASEIMNMTGPLGELRSVIIKAQHNCQSDRIAYRPLEDVPIKHEYCLVFKKTPVAR
jgi:hypothetical protein